MKPPSHARTVSLRAVDYVIAAAPAEQLLGRKLAAGYELRELLERDLDTFSEEVSGSFYLVRPRTHTICLAVGRRKSPRRAVFALIAAKESSKKKTLRVRIVEKAANLTPTEYTRMLALCLSGAFRYALMTSATQVCVRRVAPAQTELYKHFGFRIERDGHWLHALLDISTTPPH